MCVFINDVMCVDRCMWCVYETIMCYNVHVWVSGLAARRETRVGRAALPGTGRPLSRAPRARPGHSTVNLSSHVPHCLCSLPVLASFLLRSGALQH
jgi:hypothetical protein